LKSSNRKFELKGDNIEPKLELELISMLLEDSPRTDLVRESKLAFKLEL